jgi:hypothetical protein
MVLNDDNFLLYAMHNYTAPICPTIEEFENDLRILTYIKKHLQKPDNSNVRRLLNHTITLFNCFGDAALHMLFYRIDKENWGSLATILIFISRMPETIPSYGIDLTTLKLDDNLIQELRKI